MLQESGENSVAGLTKTWWFPGLESQKTQSLGSLHGGTWKPIPFIAIPQLCYTSISFGSSGFDRWIRWFPISSYLHVWVFLLIAICHLLPNGANITPSMCCHLFMEGPKMPGTKQKLVQRTSPPTHLRNPVIFSDDWGCPITSETHSGIVF